MYVFSQFLASVTHWRLWMFHFTGIFSFYAVMDYLHHINYSHLWAENCWHSENIALCSRRSSLIPLTSELSYPELHCIWHFFFINFYISGMNMVILSTSLLIHDPKAKNLGVLTLMESANSSISFFYQISSGTRTVCKLLIASFAWLSSREINSWSVVSRCHFRWTNKDSALRSPFHNKWDCCSRPHLSILWTAKRKFARNCYSPSKKETAINAQTMSWSLRRRLIFSRSFIWGTIKGTSVRHSWKFSFFRVMHMYLPISHRLP